MQYFRRRKIQIHNFSHSRVEERDHQLLETLFFLTEVTN